MNHAYHRMFSANNIYINILEQQRPIKHELKQQYATHTMGSYCGHKEKQHPHASTHAPAPHTLETNYGYSKRGYTLWHYHRVAY